MREEWLSITPEPERDLPAAIAALRAGRSPTSSQIEAERAHAERLVLRGSRRDWREWLREARELAEAAPQGDPEVAAAKQLVLDVTANHDALELGLPGRRPRDRGDERLAFERARGRPTRPAGTRPATKTPSV